MGHNTFVGHGKFVRPLFKKPSAADRVKQVTTTKAQTPRHPPPKNLTPGKAAPQFATATERTIDKQIADFREYLHNQHHYWSDDALGFTHLLMSAEKKFTLIMSKKPVESLGASIALAVAGALLTGVCPSLLPIKAIAEAMKKSEEACKKLAELSVECLKTTKEEIKKRVETEEGLKQLREPQEVVSAFFDDYLKRVSTFETAMTVAVADINESLNGTNATELVVALEKARKAWSASGFELPRRRVGEGINVEQGSLLVLYDLLRLYCRNCVELWAEMETGVPAGEFVTSTRAPRAISKSELYAAEGEVEFEGFNKAQRDAMYREFRHIEWRDTTRPRITSDEDITQWDFKTG
jgi:hypothetical protein